MKVEILDNQSSSKLTDEINKFIKGKDVVDIKYQCNSELLYGSFQTIYSALIMYKE